VAAGLTLAILALGFFFALMLCIVLKISFTFSPETLLIKKHGVFRSAKLEFVIERTSLHYFRTHFSEEEAWLQLVVKEGNQFYQIFSWKGKVRPHAQSPPVLPIALTRPTTRRTTRYA
jgi:hypothetical protein